MTTTKTLREKFISEYVTLRSDSCHLYLNGARNKTATEVARQIAYASVGNSALSQYLSMFQSTSDPRISCTKRKLRKLQPRYTFCLAICSVSAPVLQSVCNHSNQNMVHKFDDQLKPSYKVYLIWDHRTVTPLHYTFAGLTYLRADILIKGFGFLEG